MMRAAIDKRLLPRGFAPALAVAVVYTAGCILLFGFYYDLAAMAAFICAALLAAFHTHLHESEPPAKECFRIGGMMREKKKYWPVFIWPVLFWLWLFVCMYVASPRPPVFVAYWWTAAGEFLKHAALVWAMTRLPFLNREAPPYYTPSMEHFCVFILIILGIILLSAVRFPFIAVGTALSAVMWICVIYARYLYRRRKENLRRAKPPRAGSRAE